MENYTLPNITPALPEIILAASCMFLLVVGVFRGDKSTGFVSWIGVLVLLVIFVLNLTGTRDAKTFFDLFIVDDFSVLAKSLILIGSIAALIMSLGYIRREGINRFEYPILILLATLGMMMMVSANDLIPLYLGIELQSLSLYVMAAFKRDNLRSTEAGLKYFVLGALSSGMLLYGSSLIYGFSGTTNFETIKEIFISGQEPSLGIIVGLVFVISGLAFKISAVPFHMWTPDVYEGASTPVTAFLAIAPKIAAMSLFLRLAFVPFVGLVTEWQQVIVVISAASMILGAFAAIQQQNIKRLMAFSSIGHMGFALLGLASGTEQGLQSVIIYLIIYLVMNVGLFSAILTMRVNGVMVEGINDLAGLGKSNPLLALVISIFMFSLAGVPPLAGFFAKFYVFFAAIDSGLYVLAVVGALASVVGAFYYLRIVKIIYFDDVNESFEKPIEKTLAMMMWASGVFTVFFIVIPTPFILWAQIAAASLLR